MKLFHTSDIHLGSPLTSKLPAKKAAARRRELFSTLRRLSSAAAREGAVGIIISGDLFDSERITPSELDSLFSVIRGESEVAFFYLPGNHERDAVSASGLTADNLFIFGEDWTSFELGGVRIVGRSETAPNMFSTLPKSSAAYTVCALHGELKPSSDFGGVIGFSELRDSGIDYLALGHYHSYSEKSFGSGVAVYSGSPEGRGFDEIGAMGYSEITVGESGISHRFVPFAERRIYEVEVDISGALSTSDVEKRILSCITDIGSENIVRALFVGSRELMLKCDKDYLSGKLSERFYYFEIKDKSRLVTRAADYVYDRSLRGEFIRLTLSDDSLTDSEKEKIIHCGLSALSGEAFDI